MVAAIWLLSRLVVIYGQFYSAMHNSALCVGYFPLGNMGMSVGRSRSWVGIGVGAVRLPGLGGGVRAEVATFLPIPQSWWRFLDQLPRMEETNPFLFRGISDASVMRPLLLPDVQRWPKQ